MVIAALQLTTATYTAGRRRRLARERALLDG
jgi:hypothetical protein